MEGALIGGGLLVVLLLGALFWAYTRGKAVQNSVHHKAQAKHEKSKSEALEEANAHSAGSVRDRLRRLVKRKSGVSD